MWPYLTGRDWEIKFLTGGIAASCGIMVLYLRKKKKKGENVFTLDRQVAISATKHLAQLRDLPSRTLLCEAQPPVSAFRTPALGEGTSLWGNLSQFQKNECLKIFVCYFVFFFGFNNHFPVTLTNLYSSTPWKKNQTIFFFNITMDVLLSDWEIALKF